MNTIKDLIRECQEVDGIDDCSQCGYEYLCDKCLNELLKIYNKNNETNYCIVNKDILLEELGE